MARFSTWQGPEHGGNGGVWEPIYTALPGEHLTPRTRMCWARNHRSQPTAWPAAAVEPAGHASVATAAAHLAGCQCGRAARMLCSASTSQYSFELNDFQIDYPPT